jgi:radical SAM superfamily enzyme YgiQ (UPF0313 family)
MQESYERFLKYTAGLKSREKTGLQIRDEAILSIALVYPNSYEVAMANLGYQSLYRLLNTAPGVRCERVCYYDAFPTTTRSIESAGRLTHFDIIAFSISFEPDYLNVIRILRNSGLDPYAKKRHELDPVVLAGGTATFINPVPLAPFTDIFFLGEVDSHIQSMLQKIKDGIDQKRGKKAIIANLAKEAYIYAPHIDGVKREKASVANAPGSIAPQYSSIVTPDSHFENMFLVEVGRGCGRRCRFCAASHIYHPLRFFSKELILETIEKNIHDTDKVGLVGAALCDLPDITGLCNQLVNKGYKLGLSSFRFETISEHFLNVLKKAGVSTITLAPEAGTFRLRKIINKPISDAVIAHAFEKIAGSEISTIKLYFLVGLPFEEEGDIEGIIDFVLNARSILNDHSKHRKSITVSVNAFIPKPFTPFQWCRMADVKYLKKARRKIDAVLSNQPGIQVNRKNARSEMMQAIIALGDHTISDDLVSLADSEITQQEFVQRYKSIALEAKDQTSPLPWDFIDYRVSKERLWRSWMSSGSMIAPIES